ncbi:FAD-dependent oxidoreductase [Clostridium sp.]|uniref:NAD(P)/FAD-dependent oxidoreductase n=1 Tax=Clostridium sp. TaxID=1506 RepID=UPI00260914F0|nr:FAD-dependent oxidoreductase [Clostridium sp.]
MINYDLVIIGGGASGLSAGISALRNGIKNVLIIDRNNELGGNLNLFIHYGFGSYYLEKEVTGPELASQLIKDFKTLKGNFKINTEVLGISKDKIISYVNPEEGVQEIKASVVILASGCREKFTGNINIPIHKYTGVFTLAAAHRIVNIQGFLPGKEVVVAGNNKWSLILARRLILEGAKIKALLDTSDKGFSEEDLKFIKGFPMDIIKKSTVIELNGSDRLESIDIRDLRSGNVSTIECDSMILNVGYHPDMSYIRKLNIKIDSKSFPKVEEYETSEHGVFVCGTFLNGEDELLSSGESGYLCGEKAANYIKEYKY